MRKKRFDHRIILFLFYAVFVIAGLCSKQLFQDMIHTTMTLVRQDSVKQAHLHEFTRGVEKAASKRLSYHDALLDIHSVQENLMNTRIIRKSNSTLVKCDSGSIAEWQDLLSEEEIFEIADKVSDLRNRAEADGAEFLYLMAPRKECYLTFPENISNYSNENLDRYRRELETRGIPLIDYRESFQESGFPEKDLFFNTDHHWTPRAGFEANRILCGLLHDRFGMPVDEAKLDISNYEIKTYPDWFLGSTGDKAGAFFTWQGAEDIEVIRPAFHTDLSEEHPISGEGKTGPFEKILLSMRFLEKKDYHGLYKYCVYLGGDTRLQVIRNNQITDGKRVLLIKDSFALVLAPFLALQTEELHMADIRDIQNGKFDLYQYMDSIRPDYVIVLYYGVDSFKDSYSKYAFDTPCQ